MTRQAFGKKKKPVFLIVAQLLYTPKKQSENRTCQENEKELIGNR